VATKTNWIFKGWVSEFAPGKENGWTVTVGADNILTPSMDDSCARGANLFINPDGSWAKPIWNSSTDNDIKYWFDSSGAVIGARKLYACWMRCGKGTYFNSATGLCVICPLGQYCDGDHNTAPKTCDGLGRAGVWQQGDTIPKDKKIGELREGASACGDKTVDLKICIANDCIRLPDRLLRLQ
jgi:hypothetical protein